MLRKSFNLNWEVVPSTNLMASLRGGAVSRKKITLPYDNMLDECRTPDAPSGASTGFYPDKVVTLEKKFDAPVEWEDKLVIFEFEGVYSNAMVYINGDYAGGCPHGYTNFYVEASRFLRYGKQNTLRVIAKNSQDSRWYSGVGIYRNVKLLISDVVHIVPDSYRITTPEVDELGAMVEISMAVETRGHKVVTTSVATALTDAEGNVVGKNESTLTAYPGETAVARQRIYLEDVKRWNIDTPYLYKAHTTVTNGDSVLDEDTATFGIRTLQMDPKHGLRINGKTVKLRGACVHHDNGPIGAAAIDRAEERRVELLKEAGFNAVRSAHNPISKAFLSACDRVGMVVMDEISDMWTRPKTNYDFSVAFPRYWETVCERIVAKDYNHPSVVLYSIGNEIPESGTAHGASIARKLGEKIRSLDNSRYVMNSVNGMLAVMDQLMEQIADKMGGEINQTMTNLGSSMSDIGDSDLVTYGVKESHDAMDLVGYNYATTRYALEKKLFPNRVVVGSETFPKDIAWNWEEITKYDHAIGDFTWTGWDYLGEAGIGKMEYEEDGCKHNFTGEYPWYIGYCGDLDVTGLRRPVSYYREIVFGLRTKPYIAVEYPDHYGKTLIHSMWEFVDAISSWTWKGWENKKTVVHVFGVGDSFKLMLNGEEIASGKLERYRGAADVTYAPGELVAITYRDGKETGRTILRTASEDVHLTVSADRSEIRADDTDLCYVVINLEDNAGVINSQADRRVTATVTGAGELLALGSGNPKSTQDFRSGSFDTFDGRALAIIRPTGAGEITLTVEAEGLECNRITILAK